MASDKKRGNGRNKAFLMKRLEDMYGEDFHPIMNMAAIAVQLQEVATLDPDAANLKAALDGWDKIGQYVQPKLKAVELTGADGGAILTDSVFEFIPVDNA